MEDYSSIVSEDESADDLGNSSSRILWALSVAAQSRIFSNSPVIGLTHMTNHHSFCSIRRFDGFCSL